MNYLQLAQRLAVECGVTGTLWLATKRVVISVRIAALQMISRTAFGVASASTQIVGIVDQPVSYLPHIMA